MRRLRTRADARALAGCHGRTWLTGIALAFALVAIPACLFAPPRPGASEDAGPTDGAGTDSAPDAGLHCACVDDPGAQLPLSLVMPIPMTARDRLLRAGVCQGALTLQIHEAGGATPTFSARCPARAIDLPVPPLASGNTTARVRALAPYDGSTALVFIETPGTGALDSGRLDVYRIPLDGGVPIAVAGGPRATALPDGPAFVAVSHTPLTVGFGVGGDVWSLPYDGSNNTAPLDGTTPTRSGAPTLTTLAAQASMAASSDFWAAVGPNADYTVALDLSGTFSTSPFPSCSGCARITHGGGIAPPAASDVIAFSASSEGDLSVVLRDATPPVVRGTIAVPFGAAIHDLDVRTLPGEGRLAALSAGGVIATATISMFSMVDQVSLGPWSAPTLTPGLELPGRVVIGRFRPAGVQVVGVSEAPGAAGVRSACFDLTTANTLVPCP